MPVLVAVPLACCAMEGILYCVACLSICFSLVFSAWSLTTCISSRACMQVCVQAFCMREHSHASLHAVEMTGKSEVLVEA